MATPDRSRPVRQNSDAAALQARLATMTYSFAQQMPTLPPRPPHPPPKPAPKDPNFPHLSHSASPHHPSQQSWVSQQGRVTTAAEVVASKKPDIVSDDQETEQNAKHQAELALYSKLVPTTSAVPRNPGRSLGGGGLRATGSVAAQKARAVPVPTQTSLVQRKGPLASRMRSLSSDASRPQLARKIARSNRNPLATPSASGKDEDDDDFGNGKDDMTELITVAEGLTNTANAKLVPETGSIVDNCSNISVSRSREVPMNSREAHLKNIVSIYGSFEKESPQSPSRTDLNTVPQRRINGESRQVSAEANPAIHTRGVQLQVRKLDEAFSNGGRYDGVRSPSPVTTRKSQIGVMRQNSVASPPPLRPSLRKQTGKESYPSKEKNESKSPTQEPAANAPPGFESRTSTASRAAFVPRRTENDGTTTAKPVERDAVPALPQNDRADAFRVAINTRRHSSSPRPAPFRRGSKNEANGEGSQQPIGIRTVEKDKLRQNGSSKGHSRSGPFPLKQNGTPAMTSSEEVVRTRRKTEHSNSRSRREEKIFERRLERSSEVHSQSITEPRSHHTNSADVSTVSPASNTLDSNSSIQQITKVDDQESNDKHLSITQPIEPSMANHKFEIGSKAIKTGESGMNGNSDEYYGSATTNGSVKKKDFEHQVVNGWSENANGGRSSHEDDLNLLGNLLDEGDGEYIPAISAPMESKPIGFPTTAEVSMIELMRQLQASTSLTSVLNNDGYEDVVLPPLPDSEEDVRFESMLRSMGWTPPDEDETTRGNGIGAIRETTSRALRAGVGELGLNGGIRNGKGGKGQSSYYSHFQ